MSLKKISRTPEEEARALAALSREREKRESSYRGRALKLFPHICARCGREFEGRSLPELTVHHKDHDHTNNPPDGSNWELLCLYCHDNEHEKYLMKGHGGGPTRDKTPAPSVFSPFSGLDSLLGSTPAKEPDAGEP